MVAIDRYHHIRSLYGDEVLKAVQNSRILVVGAGGIGCELLKNVVLSGFSNIVVLDLDTIDVSNLNRQFLFRKHHVGLPKAIVARESVLKYNPDVSIEALHLRIQDPLFSTEYMSKFDVVLSALDNREARVYLNRLCFAARVPLIESGTSGYSGQCSPVIHGITPCFECYRAPVTQKTFAVCTIRNTPELPIHCIAWAKFLFSGLFGPQDESNVLNDLTVDASQAKNEAMEEDESLSIARYAYEVLQRCYETDIEAQILVKDRWVTRLPPAVQNIRQLLDDAKNIGENQAFKARSKAQRSLQIGSTAYYCQELYDSICRIKQTRSEDIGMIEFDKDDDDAMTFVSAAANLRMKAYHIPMISEFESKGIAGNIIHAIATTNAIAAGFSTRAALNLFKAAVEQKLVSTKQVQNQLAYVGFSDNADNILTFSKDSPNENGSCFCTQPAFSLFSQGHEMTVGQVFEVLSKNFGFDDLSMDSLTSDKSFGFMSDYLSDDDDSDDDSDGDGQKKIVKITQSPLDSPRVGLTDGSLVEIRDYTTNLNIVLRINYRNTDFVSSLHSQSTEKPDSNLRVGKFGQSLWALEGKFDDLPRLRSAAADKTREMEEKAEKDRAMYQQGREDAAKSRLTSDGSDSVVSFDDNDDDIPTATGVTAATDVDVNVDAGPKKRTADEMSKISTTTTVHPENDENVMETKKRKIEPSIVASPVTEETDDVICFSD